MVDRRLKFARISGLQGSQNCEGLSFWNDILSLLESYLILACRSHWSVAIVGKDWLGRKKTTSALP